MKKYKFNKIEQMVIEEACAKCFDEFFKKPYKRKYPCKSRKVKEARRHVIKYHLSMGNTNQIRLIADDYIYWIVRHTHKLLYPNTPDSFYVEQL